MSVHLKFNLVGVSFLKGCNICNHLLLCVASTSTSTYLLISLVKVSTEYPDARVTAHEKKGGGGRGRGRREAGGLDGERVRMDR